jgi:hypothetical protein
MIYYCDEFCSYKDFLVTSVMFIVELCPDIFIYIRVSLSEMQLTTRCVHVSYIIPG